MCIRDRFVLKACVIVFFSMQAMGIASVMLMSVVLVVVVESPVW